MVGALFQCSIGKRITVHYTAACAFILNSACTHTEMHHRETTLEEDGSNGRPTRQRFALTCWTEQLVFAMMGNPGAGGYLLRCTNPLWLMVCLVWALAWLNNLLKSRTGLRGRISLGHYHEYMERSLETGEGTVPVDKVAYLMHSLCLDSAGRRDKFRPALTSLPYLSELDPYYDFRHGTCCT